MRNFNIQKIETRRKSGQTTYGVVFTEGVINTENFKIYELSIKHGFYNYPCLVNQLISMRYPNDVMQAIINNYLLDKDDPAILAEFNEMQEWRKDCKTFAKVLLENKPKI